MIIKEEWEKTFLLRSYLRKDEYIIMPNHLHAIVWITSENEGTARRAPTNEFGRPVKQSLSSAISSFKSATTKRVNELLKNQGKPFWQRGYYEHVIRKEESLDKIREYIINNPINWSEDPENITKAD